MIVRAIDGNGDWLFGKGKNDYLTYNNAIAQTIRTRLSTFLGECFFNITVGIDWWNLLGSKNQALLNLQCSTAILNLFGIQKINQLSISLDSSRNLTITYSVKTIYPGMVSGSLSLLTDEFGNILTDEFGNPLLG